MPVDRGICCHVGGKIDFDGEGNLYLSTGDDTNPFESEGYSPIDERSNRNPAFDAQRTSANTNDLRGKILRIRVRAGGGYSVPAGNLFRPGTARTKPEIYAMGFRNPFRMAVDKKSNNVYVGDYSPDAQAPDPARGPQGIGRWMLMDRPGNYGWPYCMTRTIGYVDYDFATEESGEEFPCPNPVNESPNNTGRRVLPEVVQPDVYYSYPENDFGLFPELFEDNDGDGIGPMGGPAYDFNAQQPVRDQVAERVRRPPAVLRVDARLLQGLRAQPQERQPARRHPQPVPGRSERDHPGQPDGRGVRPGRRALHARVRRRVLPRDPGGAARPHRLRARQRVHADPEGDRGQDQLADPAAHGELLERRDARPRRRHPRVRVGLRRRRHGRLARARTRRSRTPSAASTTPR